MIPTHRYLENNWYFVSDPLGLASLQAHGGQITYLIPFWFGVTEEGGLQGQINAETLDLIERYNIPVLAIIHNYASPEYGPLIHRLLINTDLRSNLVNSILNMLRERGLAGVNIDFEFVPPEDRPYLTSFMNELYRALKPHGFLVTISVPAKLEEDPEHPFSGAFSYPDLARASDQVYILAYDEHFAIPGPIASLGFVDRVINYALTAIPRSKIRLGIPVYGYDWAEGAEVPETLTYSQAINRAERYGAVIRYDEEAEELTYTYRANGVEHIVWFENVHSFAAKLGLARTYGIPGIGVWRLGLEDPRIWQLFSK